MPEYVRIGNVITRIDRDPVDIEDWYTIKDGKIFYVSFRFLCPAKHYCEHSIGIHGHLVCNIGTYHPYTRKPECPYEYFNK